MADNLKIALQLKKAQEDISNLLDAQTKALEAQYELYRNISQNYDNVAPQEIVNRLGEMKKAIEDAGESARKSGQNSQSAYSQLKESLRRASDEQDKYTNSLHGTKKELSAIGMMAGMFDGFVSGLKFSVNSTKMFATWLKNVTKQLGMLSFSIITAPFQILRGFINDANSGGGSNALLELLEDIRKEFGNLKTTAGLATRQIARDIRHNLGSTGLSTRRVYGNLVDTLKDVFQYAKNLGVQFENITNQLRGSNARDWADYIKGLGLTEQGQKALADTSYSLGVSMNELSRQIGSASLIMGAQFGISAKHISRDVGDMMSDFKNFGNLAPSVLVNISVFARKLGVDLKGLLGVVDKFDNFEDAARSAAHLTQAFGLQLDALELMKEQDPAARIEMLRKSFFSAGRSIESMTRQERALLQQQTGLEDSALRMVFAQKNQALSYSDIQKKGAAAQKSQLNQTEVLKRLADQIERMIKSGSQMQGGFWDRFWAGFDRGMKRTIEYRRLMINLRRALRATYRTGMQVGREFVKSFPGIKQFFGSLANMFEPRRFRSLLGGVKNAFFQFFHEVGAGGGKNSFKNFVDNLKKSFLNYFNANSSDGRRILDSFKTFFRVMANVFASGVGMALKGLTKAFRFITDLLTGKQSLSGLAASGEGAAGFAAQLFEPIFDALVENGPAFGEAFINLLKAGFEKIKNYLKDNAFSIGAFLFGPAIGSAIIKGITTSMASYVGGALLDTAKKAMSHKNLTNGVRQLQESASAAHNAAGNAGGVPQGVAQSVSQVGEMARESRKFNAGELLMFGSKLLIIASVFAVGIIALAGALRASIAILRGVNDEELKRSFMVAGVAVAGMIGLSAGLRLISNINVSVFGRALAGILALSVVLDAMAINLRAMQLILYAFTPQDADKITQAMEAVSKIYGSAIFITAAATAIGAFLVSTGGLGIGIIAAGVATLAAIVNLMAINAVGMMAVINTIHIGGDFQNKFNAFIGLTTALGSFAQTFASIVKDLAPSILDYFVGSNPQEETRRALETVVLMVRAVGEQFNKIISSTMASVALISASPELTRGIQAFSAMTEAVTNIVRALQLPENFNDNLMSHLLPISMMQGIVSYMRSIAEPINSFILSTIGMINIIKESRFTEEQEKAVNIFSTFLSGVSQILEIFKPDGMMATLLTGAQVADATFSELERFFGGSGGNAFGPLVLRNMSTTIGMMVDAIRTSGIFEKIQGLIASTFLILGTLTPEQTKNISSLSPLISGIFSAVSSILGAFKIDPEALKNMNTSRIRQFFSGIKDSIPIVLDNMKQFIPDIISSLNSAIANIPTKNMKNISTITESLTSVFGIVTQLPVLVNQLGQVPGGAQGTFNQDSFKDRLGNISGMINALFPASGGPISQIVGALSRVNVPTGMKGKVDGIDSSIQLISHLQDIHFQDILNTAQANTQIVQAEAFTHIATNIQAMIQGVNEIAVQLGQIRPVNINTQLRALSRNMGLGRSEEITLQHRNFELNVTFDVKIDAEDLEKVLLSRAGTQFATNGKHTG